MEEQFDATEEILEFMEEMSDERRMLLQQRCEKAVEALGPYASEDEVSEACVQEIKVMYIGDVLQELQEDGLVEVAGINPDGELTYRTIQD